MTKQSITQDKLKELLDYDLNTGLFTWKVARSNRVQAGHIAGWKKKMEWNTYYAIKLDGVDYFQHRLAWLYMYGEFPPQLIDHINGNGRDNRIVNLRCVTPTENNRNMRRRSNNKSGICGVSFYKRDNKWEARIKADGKYKYLGRFDNKDDAVKARKKAEIEFDYHENHGRE